MFEARRMGRVTALTVSLVVFGCGGGGGGGGGGDGGAETGEKMVTASQGATVTASGGATLELPPGALPSDMKVTVRPVTVSAAEQPFLGGLGFGPQDTILQTPAKARIPLPSTWGGGDSVEIYDFQGSDPSLAMSSGSFAPVKGTPGAYYAEVEVYHFCGKVLARNCHAGTLKHLLAAFAARGCDRAGVLQKVTDLYPGIVVDDAQCTRADPEHVQALLDTYFDDLGGWNPGQDVSPDVLSRIAQYAREGRQVVLAFTGGPWGPRGGPRNFYDSSATAYPHTAVLEVDAQGVVQIRNTAVVSDELAQMLGGEAVAWYPAAKLNEFRRLQSGVALELQLCGSPGCLSDPARNSYGVALFGGTDAIDAATRPDLCSRNNGPCVPGRTVPYPGVRIYVEKPANVRACNDTTDSFAAVLTIDDHFTGELFSGKTVLAGLGTINDAGAYPTVFGSPSEMPAAASPFVADQMSITMAMNIPGPGLYSLGDDWGLVANRAVLVYTTPRIQQADGSGPMVFTSVSGSLQLDSYGVSVGSTLKGTFETDLVGEEWIDTPGGGSELHRITGHVSGTFEEVIQSL
ncbi:MAG: hypothetical protein HZB55_16950 [Deltaproteobacteria bacterium]|nr:hypothetical protein [Deltaproteobacteria bacterium]